jgi:TRAP-type mannitol/chloroaromatic compound transport system permease small subunit
MNMKSLLTKLENVSSIVGNSISFLLLALMLVSVVVVVIRYLFQSGSIALQESTVYLHAAVFTLAAGYSLQKNAHVRVDIFYQKMTHVQKAWINLFGTAFLLLPFCIFTFWVSFPYVQRSWEIGERSADAGGIPAVFLLKSLIIGLVLVLVFQALVETLRNVLIISGQVEVEENDSLEGKL